MSNLTNIIKHMFDQTKIPRINFETLCMIEENRMAVVRQLEQETLAQLESLLGVYQIIYENNQRYATKDNAYGDAMVVYKQKIESLKINITNLKKILH